MIAEIQFKTYQESVAHVKWLRTTLNNRGDDWDFAFSKKSNKLTVVMKNPKLATWYCLAFPQATIKPGSSLR